MPEPSAADRQPLPPPAMTARISKEDINLLPLGSWEGPVVVVQRVDDLEPALARLASADLLGFDTETRPAFRKGQSFPPSLLQLATADEVFLFQLKHVGLPGALLRLRRAVHGAAGGAAPETARYRRICARQRRGRPWPAAGRRSAHGVFPVRAQPAGQAPVPAARVRGQAARSQRDAG